MTADFINENNLLVRKALTKWVKKTSSQPIYGSSIFGGGDVRELEELFCKTFHSEYAVALSSCTAALHTALISAGLKKGGKVLLINNKWEGIDGLVKFFGANPIRFNGKEKSLDRQIRNLNSDLRSIIIMRTCDDEPLMIKLKEMCEDKGIIIIEDFADLKELDWKNTIAPGYGHFATFSFGHDKWIQAGEGGILLCNNIDFYIKAVQFTQHPIYQKVHLLSKIKNPIRYGLNYRIHPLAATLAVSQLKYMLDNKTYNI